MEDLQSILLPGIDSKRPIIIAGPCSAETEEQVMTTAKSLAERGIKIFRAGIWKPRTKPGGFEGIGVEGLAWLKHVKEETGMYTATEVATERHVFEALKHGIDILWIGARTTANPFIPLVSTDWQSYTGVLAATTNSCTAICLNGTFPSNYVAVSPIFLFFATLATSAVNANL